MGKNDKVFEKITQNFTRILREGTIPWHKPWNSFDAPINGATGKVYTGVNDFILRLLPYNESVFVGFRQVKELGGKVRKGEKGWAILFPNFTFRDRETGQKITKRQAEQLRAKYGKQRVSKAIYFSFGYVWNIAQCEGIQRDKLPKVATKAPLDFNPIAEAEKIWEEWEDKPEIREGGASAFYNPLKDYIQLPAKQDFELEEYYYSVLFHESIHATGHASRLGRGLASKREVEKYSFEELVAEMGAAFLCGMAGIEKPVIENSAAYIKEWLKHLDKSENKDWVFRAASQGKKAAEYILATEQVEAGQETKEPVAA